MSDKGIWQDLESWLVVDEGFNIRDAFQPFADPMYLFIGVRVSID